MGCLYHEIEGQSCLVVGVDQGLMKNRQIYLLIISLSRHVSAQKIPIQT